MKYTELSWRSLMEAISAVQLWSGRILSGLAVLFLFVDAIGKLLRIGPVVEGTVKLGYPETVVFPLGMLLLVGVVLYAMPWTSLLGAIYLLPSSVALSQHMFAWAVRWPLMSCSECMSQYFYGAA